MVYVLQFEVPCYKTLFLVFFSYSPKHKVKCKDYTSSKTYLESSLKKEHYDYTMWGWVGEYLP